MFVAPVGSVGYRKNTQELMWSRLEGNLAEARLQTSW